MSTNPEMWKRLPMPLALIWGDRDTATAIKQAENLAALTGAPLFILTDVGHIPQIEAPAEFQAALIAALADIIL
jgi:pimeloyl-ACP methyl ester carboxylesterase